MNALVWRMCLSHTVRRARTSVLALAGALWVMAPVEAAEPVDLALVLAVDASGSVSGYEFHLQMRGLAEAFRNESVLNAIKAAAPNGVAVTLVHWSSMDAQAQAFGWTVVRDAASAEIVARRIDATPRLVVDGATAISNAIDYAMGLLGEVAAQRYVIDVSGDGRDNQSRGNIAGRERAVRAGMTVNGLAILNEEPMLEYYYLVNVIGGAGAFVMGADDYDDFAEAIRIKLIREISNTPMGDRRDRPSIHAGDSRARPARSRVE
jgi:hypothetical protein